MRLLKRIWGRLQRPEKNIRQIILLLSQLETRAVFTEARHADGRTLLRHGWKAYSQNDEDGIIQEIFRRIGVAKRTFVEIGIGDGRENNTVNLLLNGWSGAWLDLNAKAIQRLDKIGFSSFMAEGRLRAKACRVTSENVNALFKELEVPEDVDLASIDIDGNDFWVWKSLTAVRPRVVVIECNPTHRPPSCLVMAPDPTYGSSSTSYHGASVKALELLGREKGYKLVSCNLPGSNAFFVREDLVDDQFLGPFTAEMHYQPPRYYMNFSGGHPPRIGKWVDPFSGN